MAISVKEQFRRQTTVWSVIGAIIVIAVVAAVMTLAHFQRQKEQAIELLVEKGATLIRSFEAGLRNPVNMNDSAFGLQKLLMETAQQPDIDYIIVSDNKGNIVADSDPSSIGDKYGLDLDTAQIAAASVIRWRQVANPEGAGTFEVYRGFFPGERYADNGVQPKIKSPLPANNMLIYVGFNMGAIEKATKEDTRNTIIIAIVLLLIGSSAIVSLFLAQAYRLARTSLSRITVFSETLVRNMPIGLVAVDDHEHIIALNEAAQNILHMIPEDTLGKPAAAVLPESLTKLFAGLPVHGGLLERDLQLIAAKGEQKTLEVIAAGLSDKGISTGRIMLLRDVTVLRHLENEVAKSRHLSSLGSLAAGVAHEIRNPLSSIKGFAVYFKERLSGNADDQNTADIMIQEVERLNRVISQLIEFARPLELKRGNACLPDLISHTLSLLAADIEKNQIAVTCDIPADLPPAWVDPDKVKQVLLNIFLNALAAMKNGGNLLIRIEPQENYLVIIISDTGTGIEKADLPRIYDPYFTSKPAGTGLGLAVVQKIMEAHGGAINVESVVGRGTTVTMQFPVVSATGKDV